MTTTKPTVRLPLRERLMYAWAHVVNAAMMLSQRIVSVVQLRAQESAEGMNIVGGLAWSVPVLFNPGYLSTSVYMDSIARQIGTTATPMVFGTLATYWTICAIAGSLTRNNLNPVRSNGRIRALTVCRMAGFAVALFVWTDVALILSGPGINPGVIMYGSIGAWSLRCWVHLALRVREELDTMDYRECRRRIPGSPLNKAAVLAAGIAAVTQQGKP